MKKACCLFVLLFTLSTKADNVTSTHAVDVGTTKAVVFDETVSPDKAYAIGWTILPKTAKHKPVDWLKWHPPDADAEDKFITTYVKDPYAAATTQDDYELINCLIDFKNKTYLELPTDEPDAPHKNRGYIAVMWGPAGHSARYAVIKSDERFSTYNFWLVTIDAKGLHQNDIVNDLNKAVAVVDLQKRPLDGDGYSTIYTFGDDNPPQTGPAFHSDTVEVPFVSDLTKSEIPDSAVEGTATVRLADGKVLKVTSETPVDDPFTSDPALAKADRELNAAYGKLAKSLSADERAALKKEQLGWIDDRNADAWTALKQGIADSVADPKVTRDKSLLESTQKQMAELQDRLK